MLSSKGLNVKLKKLDEARSMHWQIQANRSFILIGATSLVILLFSIYTEFFWKIEPCRLCKLQRYLFALTTLLSIAGIFFEIKKCFGLAVCVLSILIFGLASYHFAMQLGLIEDICAIMTPGSFIDFKNQIINSPVSCSTITLSLFGIPVTLINSIVSLVFIVQLAGVHRKALGNA